MGELVREPIGLRVLVRAVRPEDAEPFRIWRANPQTEADALIEAGQADACAALWAALLRWSEAEQVAAQLGGEGWQITMRGVRAIALPRALDLLAPPEPGAGWTFVVGGLGLRAVPERPGTDDESLTRLLAFLDEQ